MMRQVRELAPGYLEDTRMVNMFGLTDVCFAGMVLNLPLPNEKKYKTLAGIAHDCVVLMNNFLAAPVASPWQDFAEEAKSASVHDGALERMRELNPDR